MDCMSAKLTLIIMVHLAVQVVVEYHSSDVDSFIQLADTIEDAFPALQVVGVELGDGKPGHLAIKGQDGRVLKEVASTTDLSEAEVTAILEEGGYAVQ